MADDARTRAAAYVDSEFKEQSKNLVLDQERAERVQLRWHEESLKSYAQNRKVADERYVQRMAAIERGYQQAVIAVQKQQNSIGGRLEHLTKAGREKQAATREALDERKVKLEQKATTNKEAQQERQSAAEQRERTTYERDRERTRAENLEVRQKHAEQHAANRLLKIDERQQVYERAQAEQAWNMTIRQDNQQTQGRTR